jgi:hypothetical protein
MSELEQLQRAFYAFATKGAKLDGVIASGDPAIYARMYANRLHDALVEDYPKLRAALVASTADQLADPFADLARRFFLARPPRSFTLRDAGAQLPDFLRSAEPALGLWAAEMAALERSRVEVFDAKDSAALQQEEVAALGDDLPSLMLRWIPASSVVTISWNVDDMWSAIEDAVDPVAPALIDGTPKRVLVWRRDNIVIHRTLDEDEADIAPLLVDGATFTDVCAVLATRHEEQAPPRAVELLLRWLQGAVLLGAA